VVRSQLAACMMIVMRLGHMGIDPDTVCLATTPMFHSGGHEFMLLQALAAGGRVVSARTFDPETIVRLVDREKVTHAFFVPTMAVHLTDAMRRLGTHWPSLRLWVSAASPLPDPVRDRILAAVPGTQLWNCYGLTEGGTLSYLRHADIRRKPGACVGKPMIGMEVRVVDSDSGQDMPPGQVGEIICRSPESMSGYWRNPEKTAETIRNGWIYSGDLGYFDEDGCLVVNGRAKDMIITGGENVYALDVESYVLGSGLIREIAVIGLPHAVWGEAVTAVVVPAASDTRDLDVALDQYARDGLARYKCPKRFVAVPELPKNSVGKVMKDVLKARYADLYAAEVKS
jgi:acyl-CoA synthetase (AMP-forming)/AMP-acid ligase II